MIPGNMETIKVPKADIRWLATVWEGLVGRVDYPTRVFAVALLHDLVAAFMRGKGFRLGNYTQQQKHGWKHADLMTSVLGEVVERDGAETWYPALRKVGFDSLMGAVEVARQVTASYKEREVE